MSRDLDYVRQILLEMEAEGEYALRTLSHDSDEKELNNLLIMTDAGLLTTEGKYSYRITWQGFDYLDAVRDDGVWKKTQSGLRKIGGGTFEIAKEIAVAYLKQSAKEKLGLDL